VALDGGWRVYSSGAGIALSLIVRRFLGLSIEAQAICWDPVMPAALNGLRVQLSLLGKCVAVVYEIKGAGCGVNAITVNDQPISLSHDANPYRKGAARVDLASFASRLDREKNVIGIEVG
jgi:cellobiose phosphorylase